MTSLTTFSGDVWPPVTAVRLEVLGRAPVSDGDKRDVEGVATEADNVDELASEETEDGSGEEATLIDEKVTEVVMDAEGDVALAIVDAVDEADDTVDVVVAAPDSAGTVAALDAGMLVAFLATTVLYCCISMTAASRRTWMFLRQRILASTACRSWPSMAASSAAESPSKFGGGMGGGAENGRKGKGGKTKGALGAAAAAPAAAVEGGAAGAAAPA